MVLNTAALQWNKSLPCPFAARRGRVNTTSCSEKYGIRENNNNFTPGLIINFQRRIYFCAINKVGSRAFTAYFAHVNRVDRGAESLPNVKHRDQFQTLDRLKGFWRVQNIPYELISERFRNFTKILMVRHPLQRLISAYHELRSHVQFRHSTDDIIQFLEDVVFSKGPRGKDVHFLEYYQHCRPCQLHYDFILRAETSDGDIRKLSDVTQLPFSGVMPRKFVRRVRAHNDTNKYSSGTFKYDADLRKLERYHPKLFVKVLERYRRDMDLFGYSWTEHKSSFQDEWKACP